MTLARFNKAVRGAWTILLASAASVASGQTAVDLELLAGPTRLDPELHDLAWETDVRPAFGIGARLDLGPIGVGALLDVSGTTQRIEPIAPSVRLLRREVRLRVSLMSLASTRLSLEGSYGRTHVAFTPDRLEISGTEVALRPVDAPSGAIGLGVERAFGRLLVGLHGERSFLHLATAHRRDADVIESEAWFENRRLLASLGWRLGL